MRWTRGHGPVGREWPRQGFALVTSMMLLLVLTTSITTTMMVSGLQARVSSNMQYSLQAAYLAEAGLQHALFQLRRDTQWRDGIAATALGAGTYSVAVSQPTLQDDITLTATGQVSGAVRSAVMTIRTHIVTIAGTGVSGSDGDGGAAVAAELDNPARVVFDAQGNLLIADTGNHRIRRITPGADGIITGAPDERISTIAGTGVAGGGGNGGRATAAQLHAPAGLVLDQQGRLFIAEQGGHRVRLVIPGADGVISGAADEIISTVVGTGTAGNSGNGGRATNAQLSKPTALVFDAQGALFIADEGNESIRRVDPGGDGLITGATDEVITTVAGILGMGGSPSDWFPATWGRLNDPAGVFFDAFGHLLIADQDNNRIRRVVPGADGRITGALDETITTVVGTGTSGFSGDGGAATAARLQRPESLVVDTRGNLWFADERNDRIRRVIPGADGRITGGLDEIISTLAGGGTTLGDNGPSAAARLNRPEGIMVDAAGNLVIADTNQHRVRRTMLRIIRWDGA